MNVLIIGSGGREHALVWKIKRSPIVINLFCIPGNPGIETIASCPDISLEYPYNELISFCKTESIDLVVVGPEKFLVDGIADQLNHNSINCIGPNKIAAQLEGSKIFTRNLLKDALIRQHQWFSFESYIDAENCYRSLNKPWWVKADGLAAGKGSILPTSLETGCAILKQWMKNKMIGSAGDRVIIEEPLEGNEISIFYLIDGTNYIRLPIARDFKKLLDGNLGPNTGGMGAIAPVEISTNELNYIESKIITPTLSHLKLLGIKYQGFLYAGIILTVNEPYLLEYNIRLGDPETQAILPIIDSDILPYLQATVNGNLSEMPPISTSNHAVCVVAASPGYSSVPIIGNDIHGLDGASETLNNNGMIFHSGTSLDSDSGQLKTAGGRVLSIVSWDENPSEAKHRVDDVMNKITWDDIHFRHDIDFS